MNSVIAFLLLLLLFFCIRPPLALLPVLGLLEQYMTHKLDAALLYSSRFRAGSDPGQTLDWLRSFFIYTYNTRL